MPPTYAEKITKPRTKVVMLKLLSGQHELKPQKNSISETWRKFAEEWKPLTAAGQHNSMRVFFLCVRTKRGHARSGAAFSSDSNTPPPPPSSSRAWNSGLGKAREMACFPINGHNQTAIYLSWPSRAASWWLIHVGHGNSRKELIEEPGLAMACVPLQSQVPCYQTAWPLSAHRHHVCWWPDTFCHFHV